MYFFHELGIVPSFSLSALDGGMERLARAESTLSRSPASGIPVVVLDRGRGRDVLPCSRGVVGEALEGEGSLGEGLPDVATVWYVRTGSCSTTDLGARHRLLRILARRMRSA